MAKALSQVVGIDKASGQPVTVAADGTLKVETPGAPSQVIAPGQVTFGMVEPGATVVVGPRLHLDKAVKVLQKVWRTLRHSQTTQDRMWVIGHIEAFRDLEILDELEYKGWLLQIDICPGHDEGFNPAECAYCAPKV